MSESQNTEIMPIKNGIDWWLGEETYNSDTGRNKFLSEFFARRGDFSKPFDDPGSVLAQKAISHHNHIRINLRQYREDPNLLLDNPLFAAKITFYCLMEISGAKRKQDLLLAVSAKDYKKRRYESPLGVDIDEIIKAELAKHAIGPDGKSDDARVADFVERASVANDISLLLHQSIHDWVIKHPKSQGMLATPEDEPVKNMIEAQRLWAGLAVAHVALVATSFSDGGYAQVPVLEPKSITDATELTFPFVA